MPDKIFFSFLSLVLHGALSLCHAQHIALIDTCPSGEITIPDSLCINKSGVMKFTGTAPVNAIFTWIFENGPTLTGKNLTSVNAAWSVTGKKKVILLVEIPGCAAAKDSAEIWITDLCEIKIPNVFTPDTDGKNDLFVISGLERYPGSQVEIYNRWGKLVYENSDYKNNWNGRDYKNGSLLNDGVYYYIVKLADGNNHYGFVTMLKK